VTVLRGLTLYFGYIKKAAIPNGDAATVELTRITESPEVRLAAYTRTAELCIAPYGRPYGA
jgi:hypothetical protein